MDSLNVQLTQNFFRLSVDINQDSAKCIMEILNSRFYSTKNFPQTLDILKQSLPQIFYHQCFNDKKLSFLEEAKNTEVAHLFEHIILEYLSQSQRDKNEHLFGETNWNWYQDQPGVFKISLNFPKEKPTVLVVALEHSINLLEKILNSVTKQAAI